MRTIRTPTLLLTPSHTARKSGKCDRCGRVVNHLWTMGNMKTIYVCDKCHGIWRNEYITKLNLMNLEWKERKVIWEQFFEEFLATVKEKVQFT